MGRNAVVVGAGIGGLAAAIGLRRTGWEVTVVDRSPTLDDAGAGISLAANGIRALDALGVGAAVRAAGRGQYTGGTRTPNGSWLARMDGAALERALGSPIVGIPRAELHRLLRSALAPGTVRTGVTATATEPLPDGRVRVTLTAGDAGDPGTTGAARAEAAPVEAGPVRADPLEADLVVAADGIGSRLRTALFPGHPGPAYSGSTVLRAVTDRPLDLRTDFEITWGHGAEFGHIAFTDGRAEWHAVLNSPANLGQGACQALEDAVVLAAELDGTADVDAALARYDAVRRPRATAVAAAARQAGRMGQRLAHPLAVPLRNTLLRLAPSGTAVRMILRHTSWTPPLTRSFAAEQA
ncbi:FAD-dependent monooxygenase [Streptomyces laurentii]|uniref:FAD-dependent monooxygenase n=1 Tax=Streptomyces laurentii TaxID=39478 RepID=UPI0033EA7192